MIFCFCGVTPFGVKFRPRKSTSFVLERHFALESSNPAFGMHLKTPRKLVISGSGEFAAIPMSTYCAHWSALISGFKCSCIEPEKADSDLLRPFANLRFAKVCGRS